MDGKKSLFNVFRKKDKRKERDDGDDLKGSGGSNLGNSGTFGNGGSVGASYGSASSMAPAPSPTTVQFDEHRTSVRDRFYLDLESLLSSRKLFRTLGLS